MGRLPSAHEREELHQFIKRLGVLLASAIVQGRVSHLLNAIELSPDSDLIAQDEALLSIRQLQSICCVFFIEKLFQLGHCFKSTTFQQLQVVLYFVFMGTQHFLVDVELALQFVFVLHLQLHRIAFPFTDPIFLPKGWG